MKLTWAMNLPEAWRLLRICWQPKRLAAVAILPLIISFLVVAYMAAAHYQENKSKELSFLEGRKYCVEHFKNENSTAEGMSTCYNANMPFEPEPFPYSTLFGLMLGLQGLLWVFAAPVAVGISVHSEFDKDTWVLQQTTPQSSRKLLLGKILGAPGDIYIISALNLPFVVAPAVMGRIPLLIVPKIMLLWVVLFLLVSPLVSYIMFISGKTKSSPGLLLGLFLFLMYSFSFGLTGSYMAINTDDSVINILPMSLYINAVSSDSQTDAIASGNDGDTTPPFKEQVLFFNRTMPAFPFAIAFYLTFAAWFFSAADAELRRKTSLPSRRHYLFALFALTEFFFIGFTSRVSPYKNSIFYFDAVPLAYNALVLALAYFVIFSQTRTTGEMRPWIYRSAARKRALPDLFSDDSPPAYSLVAILLIIIAGTFAIPVKTQNIATTHFLAHVIQAGCISAIIMRDVLFFQIAKMTHKRGIILGLLIYAIFFIAVPGLAIIPNGKPLFDLSPLTALISIPILAESDTAFGANFLYAYMIYNAALALLFYGAHTLLISAARRKFNPSPKADISPTFQA